METINPILTIILSIYNQAEFVLTALNSIPKRKDIELLIIDDCSTDNSLDIVLTWREENINSFNNIVINHLEDNYGCGYTRKVAYPKALGEYIIILDSDDYFYTDVFNKLMDRLYSCDEDIIFIGNDVNNGECWTGNDRKAPWSYFLRNEFFKLSNIDYPDKRRAGDLEFTTALRELPRNEIVWTEVAYHYNYPREGSIVWNYEHGVN